ncbi:hypothetical protein KEM52_004736 [Ascosphaera acerosa]|nr:hypothetical protein KEM52_004736 [Ascosphaera acerosa]
MAIVVGRSAFRKWYRSVGYHHYLVIILVVAIILLSLLLAGCSSSSPRIPEIFLASFYYDSYSPVIDGAQADPAFWSAIQNVVGGAELEVRVGYFGICIQPDGGSYICNNNATILADVVNADQDPLNLIWVAKTFRDAVVFPYLTIVALILAFFAMLLLLTFPGWHAEATQGVLHFKRVPSRAVSQVCLALCFVATVFVLVTILWQHTASVAATTITRDFGNGAVKAGVGTSAMVMGWFGFALLTIATIGMLIMILSISWFEGKHREAEYAP